MDTTHTDMGSPCSPRWDDDWIAAVNDAEEDRRNGNTRRAKARVEAAIELAPEVAGALKDPNAMDPFPMLATLFEEGCNLADQPNPFDPFAVMALLMGWKTKEEAGGTQETTQTAETAAQTEPP